MTIVSVVVGRREWLKSICHDEAVDVAVEIDIEVIIDVCEGRWRRLWHRCQGERPILWSFLNLCLVSATVGGKSVRARAMR
jgi:hypothetical protein